MEEIDLKELIEIFLEKKILIILIVIIFGLIGAIFTLKFITPKYQSETSLVLVQTGSENSSEVYNSITTTDITLNSKLIGNYKDIVKSKSVSAEVKNNLNLDMEIKDIQDSITVSSSTDTEILRIAVQHVDPNLACKIANEVATVFKEKVSEMYSVSNVYVLDVAEIADSPYNINLVKNIVIFAFIGGVIVLGYILLTHMLDTTIKTDQDIEKNIGLPVLATILLTSNDNVKKNTKNNRKKFNPNKKKSTKTEKKK